MIFSRASSYGILTVIYLTLAADRRPIRVRAIADSLGISSTFLAKIVQTLVQQGIICSFKGPGGGIRLARSPKELTLGQVVVAIEGIDHQAICVLGMPGCSMRKRCLFRACQNKIQHGLSYLLSDQNVFQVASDFNKERMVHALLKNDKMILL